VLQRVHVNRDINNRIRGASKRKRIFFSGPNFCILHGRKYRVPMMHNNLVPQMRFDKLPRPPAVCTLNALIVHSSEGMRARAKETMKK